MQSSLSGRGSAPSASSEEDLVHSETPAQVIRAMQGLRESLFRAWMTDLKSESARDAAAAAIDDLLGLAVLVRLVRQTSRSSILSMSEALASLRSPSIRAVHGFLRRRCADPLLAAVLDAAPFRCNRPLPARVVQQAVDSWICGNGPQPRVQAATLGDLHQLCLGRSLQLLAPGRANPHQAETRRYNKGIYYTPIPLVDYLIDRTLDSTILPVSPPGTARLRILDPSCGCGAFLVAALARLLEHCRDTAQSRRASQQSALPAQLRLNLLASAVYGYDVDKRAIGITTCLLLAAVWQTCIADGIVLDGHGSISVPDLSRNLICADFLNHRTGRDILAAGGVDVILGGPPFVRIEQLFKTQRSKIVEYRRRFSTAQSGQFDLYMLFIEKALQLLRQDGQLAMSLSSSFLRSSSGRTLRHLIARQCHVREIVQFACDKVYPDASVQIALLHLQKLRQLEPTRYVLVDKPEALRLSTMATSEGAGLSAAPKVQLLPPTACSSEDWNLASGEDARILHRIDTIGTNLSDLGIDVRLGACTGTDEVFLAKTCNDGPTSVTCEVQVASGSHVRLERAVLRPILRGRNVLAWCKPELQTHCICPYDSYGTLLREAVFRRRYPLAYRYLLQHRQLLDARHLADAQAWYSFRRPSLSEIVGAPKLLAASIGSSGFTIDTTGLLCHSSVVLIMLGCSAIDPYFVLGVLNSQLFRTYIHHKAPCVSARGHCLRIHMLRQFPFVLPRGTISSRIRDQISLQSRDLLRRAPGQSTRQLTDPVLDQLVWRLYGIPGQPDAQESDRAVTCSQSS